MALGAVDHVPKSTDLAYLRARVDNFIKFLDRRRGLQADYDALMESARKMEEAEQTTRHDLKGSLAGIVGMVKSLAEDDAMAPKHVSKLRMVEQTASQAMEMVRLSSELYKMEHGEFTLHPVAVDIGPVLRHLAEMMRDAFSSKGLVISVESDVPVGLVTPSISGDALLCHSLFQNLIKNACEAAPAGTRVDISLLDQSPIKVEIRNKGAVPLAIRDRFFDKFTTSGKTHGTGLGTYSARKLANAQGGDVTMRTSYKDDSTTVTVSLPRHAVAGTRMPEDVQGTPKPA
jgi:signal transduction histidine kinase